jgi:F-type H+-transporting ATPase subunit a
MHQFAINAVGGGDLVATPFQFTNSALWMFIVLACILAFMWGGLKREIIPGRWQVAVEGFVEFISGMTVSSIGPEGRKFTPWIFTIFTFILFANYLSLFPSGFIHGGHPFAVTAQFTVTGMMAAISFGIVLVVGFWRHKLHFFSLFVPHGTPKPMVPLIALIEFISFMVRPFSLALRLFVAMIAGHILFEVFGNFVVQGINSGTPMGYVIAAIAFIFVLGVNALELLVCAIQAYVFALLSSLYINDAVNLH